MLDVLDKTVRSMCGKDQFAEEVAVPMLNIHNAADPQKHDWILDRWGGTQCSN